MDSNSQFFGDVEECNSSESGWTMYIGSPSDGDGELEYSGDSDELEENNNKKAINRDDEEEDDTDDSMASDASSGPSHFSRNGKSGGVAMVNFKNPKEKGKEKHCGFTNNKAKNSMKNGYKNDQDKVKESIFAAKEAKGASNGGSNKVRRSIWMGKGK